MQQASKAAMALRIGRGSGSFRCGITPWKASENSHQPHFGYGNFKVYWMQPRYIDTVIGDRSIIGGKEKACDIYGVDPSLVQHLLSLDSVTMKSVYERTASKLGGCDSNHRSRHGGTGFQAGSSSEASTHNT